MDSSFYKDLDKYLANVRKYSKIPIVQALGLKIKMISIEYLQWLME
jgi:hypothetical protein